MSFSESQIQQYAGHRQKMVERHLLERDVKDLRVLEAMSRVPRHLFVPAALQHRAYGDHALPIGENQTISQPYMVGLMSQLLRLSEKDKILEIGTGSGYQTAVLAELAEQVFTIERIKNIGQTSQKLLDRLNYRNIVYKIFDGTNGWRDQGPYDAILITAGVQKVPPPLVDQLKDGGRLVIPIGDLESQKLTLVTKKENRVESKCVAECKFVKLIGKFGWADN
jgi:protein-L-isoaspartate(D-aspartate) O-methyltransferase